MTYSKPSCRHKCQNFGSRGSRVRAAKERTSGQKHPELNGLGLLTKGNGETGSQTALDRLKGRAGSRTDKMEHVGGCHTVYGSGEKRCGVHKNKEATSELKWRK